MKMKLPTVKYRAYLFRNRYVDKNWNLACKKFQKSERERAVYIWLAGHVFVDNTMFVFELLLVL